MAWPARVGSRLGASDPGGSPRRTGRASHASLIVGVALLAGCHNHFLIHPRHPVADVQEWSEEIERNGLEMRFAWVRPAGDGPFATVLVHPEAWRKAGKMRGILRDLATEGYLAAAVDYRREPDPGSPRSTFFAWRSRSDAAAAVEHVLADPDADPRRFAAVGYSQGAMYSLLIAAYTDRPAAVVAYYPIGDVEGWLHDDTSRNWATRQVFKLVRRIFRRRSGADTEEDYLRRLRAGSPLYQVQDIDAPVMLIHGDADSRVDIGESRRLAAALRSAGVDTTLLEIPRGEHVFNFRRDDQARFAWKAMLEWLALRLASAPESP